MKKIISAICVAIIGSSAFAADIQTMVAKDETCATIQSTLKQDGALNLIYGFGDWARTHYASAYDCGPGMVPHGSRVRASDKWCKAGYVCEEMHDGGGQD